MLRNALLFVAISLVAIAALARVHEDKTPLVVDTVAAGEWDFNNAATVIEEAPPEQPRMPPMRLYTTCPLDQRNVPILEGDAA